MLLPLSMIKRGLLLALLAQGLWATVTINSVNVTATQLVIDVTAPDSTNACQFEVSESVTYLPPIHDTDGSLFTGANLDTRPGAYGAAKGGTHRVFVAGTKTVMTGNDGRKYSRAAQQGTQHFIRVSCGVGLTDQATTTATTSGPVFGRSVRDPMLRDSTTKFPLWPDWSLSDRSEVVIEPMTGARIRHFGMPSDALWTAFNVTFASWVDPGGVTHAGGCAGASGWSVNCTGTSSFTSTSCSVACGALVMSRDNGVGHGEEWESNITNINFVTLHFTGQCSGVNTLGPDCEAQVCWSWDAVTCAGPWVDVAIPTTSGPVSLCAKDGTTHCVIGDLLGADYRGFYHTAPSGGAYDYYSGLGDGLIFTPSGAGSTTTLQFTAASDCNRLVVNENFATKIFTSASFVPMQVASKSCGSMPPQVTLASAVDLDITGTGAAGYSFFYSDGFQDNPRWSLMVRKKSLTANNTISITNPQFDPQWGGYPANTSAGYNEYCSQYEDGIDSFGGHTNRKCRLFTKVYSYHPVTGVVKYLGQTFGFANNVATGDTCQQVGGGTTFWQSANTYLTTCNKASDGTTRLWLVDLSANTDAANDVQHLPTGAGACDLTTTCTYFISGVTYTDKTGDLLAAAHAYDSTFDNTKYTTVGLCGVTSGRYVHLFFEYGNQDTIPWFMIWDLTTNGYVAKWNPNDASKAAAETGFSVNHACFSIAPTDGAAPNVNLMGIDMKQGRDSQATTGGGAYHFTLTSAVNATQTSFPISTLTPTSPVYLPTTLRAIVAGDTAICEEGGGSQEAIKFVMAAIPATVTRGYKSTAFSHSMGADCIMYPGLGMATLPGDNSGQFWDFLADPTGPTTTSHIGLSLCPGGGHAVYYGQYSYGSPNLAGNYTGSGLTLANFPLCSPFTYFQDYSVPLFSSTAYGPQSGGTEGHPSFKPTPYPLDVDNHPNQGEAAQYDTITQVSGTLFLLTYNENPFGAAPVPVDNLSYKFLPRSVTSQGRLFIDVSGPGSTISDTLADAFKYCVVLKANECRSGSTVTNPPKVYVNSGYMDPQYFAAASLSCTLNDAGVENDLCFMDDGQRESAVVGYIIPSDTLTHTNTNKSFPILYQFGMAQKGQPDTANSKVTWGNWTFGTTFQYGGQSSYFVKEPDTNPDDGVDRTVFASSAISISSPPAGTTNVIVRYGYQEYGTSGVDEWTEHYCNTRRERCVVNSNTINATNPFLYPVEGSGGTESGITGLACTASCAPVIPTIPDYIVYPTVVFRDSMNNTISTLDLPPMGGFPPAAPTITTGCPLLQGSVGVPYSQTLTATGSTPITWSIPSGILPTGLSLAGATISGTPAVAGFSSFSIQAVNSIGNSTNGPLACSITINNSGLNTGGTIMRRVINRGVVVR